jgi:hypothetical protein
MNLWIGGIILRFGILEILMIIKTAFRVKVFIEYLTFHNKSLCDFLFKSIILFIF